MSSAQQLPQDVKDAASSASLPADRRFPARVYRQGSEPDARFTMANERTFLTWISTALALVSVGVGLEAFGLPLTPILRQLAAGVLIVTGVICPIAAWFGWARTETALRRGERLPSNPAITIITIGVLLSFALVIAGLLIGP